MAPAPRRWLLLIHQIPPTPAYLRVKVGRQLAKLGAVAIKNSVYALPASESAAEAFAWLRKEIAGAGGDASVIEGSFVEGLEDADVEALFREARDEDYAALAAEARSAPASDEVAAERLERRLREIEALDFFGAAGRAAAVDAIAAAKARGTTRRRAERPRAVTLDRAAYRGRTWVTREHVGVDRMASAWLIRRVIDPKARFRFVPRNAPPRKGEIRFDMFEGDFTHEGDRCTFEVLLAKFGLDEPALREIGEIVHELDLEDGKFARAEVPGIARVVASIAAAHAADPARLERSAALFDDLRALHSTRKGRP